MDAVTGHPAPAADPEERNITDSAAGLRREARIDLDALAANLALLTARFGSIALDVRADAHGHSLELIVPVALELGVAGFVTSGSTSLSSAEGREVVSAAAYGVDADAATRPVMTVVGEVVSVKRVPPGSGVSYGYSYRTTDRTTLSLVGLGYADGIPRWASNRASVWVGDRAHPLVGRVAMDQLVVDSAGSAVEVGDDAVLFGDPASGHPTAVEWAELTGRSALELTAGIGPRVRRVVAVPHG
jgi:alanine racemase